MAETSRPACEKPTRRHPEGRTGTNAGYFAHRTAKEHACEPCRRAAGEYSAAVLREKRSLPLTDTTMACEKPGRIYTGSRTGTRAGYLAHYYVGQEACDACLAGLAAAQAQAKVDDPDRDLRWNLRYKYKMSLEEYKAKLAAQGGKCAICGADGPSDIRTNRFHVDHDHRCCSGKRNCGECTRGLLCHACNTALGNFKDDPDLLLAALSYLLSYGLEAVSQH